MALNNFLPREPFTVTQGDVICKAQCLKYNRPRSHEKIAPECVFVVGKISKAGICIIVENRISRGGTNLQAI